MKFLISTIFSVFFLSAFVIAPLALAQAPINAPSTSTNSGAPINSPSGGVSVTLDNPLNDNIVDVEDLVQAVLNVLIIIAAPIVVIFIILAGFKYVTAQGDPGKLEEAKKALVYAIIGGVLIVGATAIFEIVVNTINAFRN